MKDANFSKNSKISSNGIHHGSLEMLGLEEPLYSTSGHSVVTLFYIE